MNRPVIQITAVALFLVGLCESAFGLGFDYPAGRRVGGGSDWPKGYGTLINGERIGERIHGYSLNGDEVHFFSGDSESLNAFLETASRVTVRKRTIVFHAARGAAKSPWWNEEQRKPSPCDWSIGIFAPIARADSFRIDVFLGGEIDRDDLRVPVNFAIDDSRLATEDRSR